MCQNATKESHRPNERPTERHFLSVTRAQKSRMNIRMKTRICHPNSHPSFFMSPRWFLVDPVRFLGGSFVVLQRSGNLFFSSSPTDPILPYQG
jgi:hypothetical protein